MAEVYLATWLAASILATLGRRHNLPCWPAPPLPQGLPCATPQWVSRNCCY